MTVLSPVHFSHCKMSHAVPATQSCGDSNSSFFTAISQLSVPEAMIIAFEAQRTLQRPHGVDVTARSWPPEVGEAI